MSHTRTIAIGDRPTAVITKKNLTNATGLYQVKVTNQHNQLVASFKGTFYRKVN